MGVISPVGSDLNTTWESILRGEHGFNTIKSFDTTDYNYTFSAEIEEFEIFKRISGKASNLFLNATLEALNTADICSTKLKKWNAGLCVGTTMGEIDPLEEMIHPGSDRCSKGGPHVVKENVLDYLELKGPSWTITNACAAGNLAIAKASEEIKTGNADLMIAGGVDIFSRVAHTGFSSLRAVSKEKCRPFSKNRDGLILGEGAGVLILESESHLRKRKGTFLAKVSGYNFNCDGRHITQPDPKAISAVQAMKKALNMARLKAEEIDYISAHGTGTKANDLMESVGIQKVFDEEVPVNSIKGHIGHSLGAASAIEAICCINSLGSGLIPHTLWLDEKDPQCKVNIISKKPYKRKVQHVMSNAYAFGGINSSIILSQ